MKVATKKEPTVAVEKQTAIENPTAPATRRQTWALFCATKRDYRSSGLTRQQASDLLASFNKQSGFVKVTHAIDVATAGDKIDYLFKSKGPMEALYDKAHAAGMAAGNAATPQPMLVSEHENMADDKSPIAKSWLVTDGPCGFAWIVIRPARGAFVTWLKKAKIGGRAYGGGYYISASAFNQSMQRKERYAASFAQVLGQNGIQAHMQSRMD